MLTIKTKIAPSPIHGIGLFADDFIPKGTPVWKYMPGFDALYTKAEIETLSMPAKEQFYQYAFLDKKYGKYMLCFDDARYFNHSENPNCDDRKDDITTAIRDIQLGEELTVDYHAFYGNDPELQ